MLAGFTFIDFPPYYEGCRIESGGTLETTGCGSPKGFLKKAAHIKFPIISPSMHINSIQKCHFVATQIGLKWLDLVDTDQAVMSHADAATAFIAEI